MCNQIALAIHCRPGDEIIAEETAHIINFEVGGAAVLANAMIRPVKGTNGLFALDQLEAAIRPAFRHAPKSRLVSVEQTSNLGGGSVWPRWSNSKPFPGSRTTTNFWSTWMGPGS